MLLLYCANGIVVGMHDDTQPSVPASAYPSGARIIPYDQSVVTLGRVGPPPPPPPPARPSWMPPPRDDRPYAQPTETPAILIGYSAQVRFQKSVTDVSFTAASGVVPVHADRLSQMLLSNLALHAQSLAGTTAIDFTQDNVHYAVTAAETISMFNAVYADIQACRTIEAQCIADLNAGTTTVTAATWSGPATTSYTTAAPHGYAVGATVTISGSNPSTYDGTFITVAGTTGSTIVVDMTTDPGAWVSGGSVGSTTVTAAVWSGPTTTTYTTAAAHGWAVGDTVTISGSNPSTYDGTFATVTGTTGSTIIVDMATDPGAWTSGGTLLMKTSTLLTYADVDAQFASV